MISAQCVAAACVAVGLLCSSPEVAPPLAARHPWAGQARHGWAMADVSGLAGEIVLGIDR